MKNFIEIILFINVLIVFIMGCICEAAYIMALLDRAKEKIRRHKNDTWGKNERIRKNK